MELKVAIYQGKRYQSFGWQIVCEQERIPFIEVCELTQAPVLLIEGETPIWLEEYLIKGGVAIITEANPVDLPFEVREGGQAAISEISLSEWGLGNVQIPCYVNLFAEKGIGAMKVHQKRITKNNIKNGRYPIFIETSWGKGKCIYTGVPLTRALSWMGDTLRSFTSICDITERVTTIDKAKIVKALVRILRRGFVLAEIPYVHLWYYPGGSRSVLAFRIDVDGVYGENLLKISRTGKDVGWPIGFYVNKSMCVNDASFIQQIDSLHEIGNHGDIHNLYDTIAENERNILSCAEWLDEIKVDHGNWYVAPRGMWNLALHQALEKLGYEYTSDFGIDIDGLPYFPRIYGRRSTVLQIPIHPYSTERHTRWAEERKLPGPEPEMVVEYFINIIKNQINNNLPVFLYSHPQFFGPMAEQVLPAIATLSREMEIPITTLSKFSNWWKRRDVLDFSVEYDRTKSKLSITGNFPDDIYIHIHTQQNSLEISSNSANVRVYST